MMSRFARGVCVLEDGMVGAVLGLVFVETWYGETVVIRRRIEGGMVDALRGRMGCHDGAAELCGEVHSTRPDCQHLYTPGPCCETFKDHKPAQ